MKMSKTKPQLRVRTQLRAGCNDNKCDCWAGCESACRWETGVWKLRSNMAEDDPDLIRLNACVNGCGAKVKCDEW